MKTCRVVPTPTGYEWGPDNRPDSPPSSDFQCVFAVAYDHCVPNHTIKWEAVGRSMDEIPDSVHRGILHLDRSVGTEADVTAILKWAARALRVTVVRAGRLPPDVPPFAIGLEDRLWPGE